ncbi:S8 family serine peptidase [Paenibacillus agilis]|nr:S8 family serine peptidase [Paenibacillus agilis]
MKRKLAMGLSIALTLSLFAPVFQSNGFAAEPSPSLSRTLYLKTGDVNLQDLPQQQSLSEQAQSNESALYVVQFKDVITQASKELLSKNGAVVGDYLPDFAYLVRINGKQAHQISTSDLVYSVTPFQADWKIGTFATPDSIPNEYVISTFPGSESRIASLINPTAPQDVRVYDGSIEATLTDQQVYTLLQDKDITFIETKLRYETSNEFINQQIGTSTPVTGVWAKGLTGAGQIVAVGDSGLDSGNVSTVHQDFTGQLHVTPIAKAIPGNWSDPGGHGTHVAGTVLGTGKQSSGKYKGVAPGAKLVLQALGTGGGGINPGDVRQLFAEAEALGAKIHTNSWGASSNSYNTNAQRVDEYTFKNKHFNVLFAAGNSGSFGNNTIATPGTSKNAITVGSLAKTAPNSIASYSSRGFTFDGRTKPDVVVTGTSIISPRSTISTLTGNPNQHYATLSGTSMATPAVAGSAALVRQYFNTVKKIEPTAALVKATLINGAQDVGYGWGSRETGWGRVNLEATLYPTNVTAHHEDHTAGLSTGNVATYTVDVASGQPLKISTVWSDFQAAVSTTKALVNDLDLEVVSPSGQVYKGNCFVSNTASTSCASFDRANNVENVYFNTSEAGKYTIRVKAYNVPQSTQPFALVVSGKNAALTKGGAAPVEGQLLAPTNLTATPDAAGGVVLSWTDSNNHATPASYEIYNNAEQIGASSSPTLVINQGLVEGATYTFTVKVRNSQNVLSPASNAVTFIAQPIEEPENEPEDELEQLPVKDLK